jgi:hypothetical protein
MREIVFQGIYNFRDPGGCYTRNGRKMAEGRLFRSATPEKSIPDDLVRLKDELKLKRVINLRDAGEEVNNNLNLFWQKQGIQYFNTPMKVDPRDEAGKGYTEMGSVYIFRLGQPEYLKGLLQALRIIAEPENLQ